MAEWTEGTACRVVDKGRVPGRPLAAVVDAVDANRVTARLATNGARWGFSHEGRSLWDGEGRWRLMLAEDAAATAEETADHG